MTTYIQATLRYVNKMDKDVITDGIAGWKNQGEGWGFSLVIADSLSATSAATIDQRYNLATRNTNTDNYCVTFDAVSSESIYDSDAMGALNEALAASNTGTATAPVCVVVPVPEVPSGGQCGSPYDINDDGVVGVDDLLGLLASYGDHVTPCSGTGR